jgi:hypothetical protein
VGNVCALTLPLGHARPQPRYPSTPRLRFVARPEAVYVLQGRWLEQRERQTLDVVRRLAIPDHSDRMAGCDSIDSEPRTPLLWVAVILDDGTFRAVEIDAHDLSVLHVSDLNE